MDYKNTSCVPNQGISWGLEYPLVYGQLTNSDDWAVWDRHTRKIEKIFPHKPNVHGWSDAKDKAKDFSVPKNYSFHPDYYEIDLE